MVALRQMVFQQPEGAETPKAVVAILRPIRRTLNHLSRLGLRNRKLEVPELFETKE